MSIWYAIRTRQTNLKKIERILIRNGLSYFLPLISLPDESGSRLAPDKFLLHSCVFVRQYDERPEANVHIPGLGQCLFWLNKPAVFINGEVEMLQTFLKNYNILQLEKISIRVGELAEVYETKSHDNTNFTRLSLPSLGYLLIAEINTNQPESGVSRQMLPIFHPNSEVII